MNSIHSNHAIMNSQRISLLVTSYIVLILSITSLVPVEGIEVGELLADHGCSVRWGFVDSLKANVNCSEVAAVNNVCARDLQVVYEEHMPYVFYSSQTSQVEGILPGIRNCSGRDAVIFLIFMIKALSLMKVAEPGYTSANSLRYMM